MGIIRIEGLKKVYDTGLIKFEALKGVDFSIEKGEFVAIMGQSGSGKSTLMNIIGCLDVATEGKYFLGVMIFLCIKKMSLIKFVIQK